MPEVYRGWPVRKLYQLNPACGIIEGFRDALLYGRPPDTMSVLLSAVVTLAVLVAGLAVFRPLSAYFADHS